MSRKLLLDTHVLLWISLDAALLSTSARENLEDPDAELCVSAASLWEISIKLRIGKLDLRGRSLHDLLDERAIGAPIRVLPIALPHLELFRSLSLEHRDPFDALIAAQSIVEDCILVSKDAQLDVWGGNRIW